MELSVFEISAIIVLIVFGVIAYFLVQALISLNKVLHRIDDTLQRTEPITEETAFLLENVNSITETVQDQLDSFAPFFNSVAKLGNTLSEASESLSTRIKPIEPEQNPRWQKKMVDLIELATLGAMAWQQLKKRR